MRRNKYVIVSPNTNFGGTVVLHALYKYLSDLGENVKIYYINNFQYTYKSKIKLFIYLFLFTIKDISRNMITKFLNLSINKNKNNISIKSRRKYFPLVSKNTIVIYPEICFGNFLHSKKVVRWLLYHNKIYKQENGKTVGYDDGDLFFCYRDIFNDPKLNPGGRKLTISYFDLDTYKRTNYGKREGKCYIVRKGAGRKDLPKEFDGPVIDNVSEKEKVEYFNKCEYCISYDTQTAYSKIAALCGCISIVMPEKGKTREDYRKTTDIDYGEAFGFDADEIKYAKETAPELFEYYKNLNHKGIYEVEKFIDECESYFKN